MPKKILDVSGAPPPMGPYSVATEANGFVFISGQVPIDPSTGRPVDGDSAVQTRRVVENLGVILSSVGLGYEDVVKTTIFLVDIADFSVVNEVYGIAFGHSPPARSTVQVGALPGGFLVEIEAIAAR